MHPTLKKAAMRPPGVNSLQQQAGFDDFVDALNSQPPLPRLAQPRLSISRRMNISTARAGQKVDLKEVDDGIWLVSFMTYDPGYIDLEQKTLQP